jgi:uncharacterized protein YaeQ
MALKPTIFKALLQIADIDRGLYVDRQVTLGRHPSETDERLMLRLVALALHVPADTTNGTLEFAKGLWDTDEPELWHKDLTGRILHWIEIGQPDDKRILKAAGRAERVTVLSHTASTPIWWSGIESRISRTRNVDVWQVDADAARELAGLAARSMRLQVSVQDGTLWVGDGERSVELTPVRLNPA